MITSSLLASVTRCVNFASSRSIAWGSTIGRYVQTDPRSSTSAGVHALARRREQGAATCSDGSRPSRSSSS